MANFLSAQVTQVSHWSDKLFSFRTTRDRSLRFENGQFVMLGLDVEGRRLTRAYSIASANYEDELEFYSIKVPNGPLTSRLQHIHVGDQLWISAKPTGTLVLRDLRPEKRLYLFATGTGIAPFGSLLRDVETYDRFDTVILARGARFKTDLAYGDQLVQQLRDNELIGDRVRAQLLDYATVTREPFEHTGRLSHLIESDRLTADLGLPALDPATDRAMICGSAAMLQDISSLLDQRGLECSPRIGEPGDYVIERAFVGS